MKTATLVVVSMVLSPLLALNIYLLAWFMPELTAGRPGRWLMVCALTAAAAVCLIAGWMRRHRVGRWWIWPLGAAASYAASWPVVDQL